MGVKEAKACITVVQAVFTIGLTIASFLTTLRSFRLQEEIRLEYGDIIDHWQREPLQVMNASFFQM